MKSKIRNTYKYIPILIFFIYAFWIHHDVVLLEGDDMVFKDSLKNMTILEWCKSFYMQWGGRVPIHLLIILFLNLPLIFWKIYNSILYILVLVYIYRYICLFYKEITDKQLFIINTLVSMLFIIIPDSIVNSSIIWITGSFNYLLPSTMVLIGLYPFLADVVDKKVSKIDIFLAWIGVFIASYAEQTAAVFICMTVFCLGYLIYRKRKISLAHISLFVFGVINSIVQYAAPGNLVRYDAELLRWYQSFDMYNIFDKVLLGLIHCLKSVFMPGFPLFILILFFLGILTLKKDFFNQLSYLILCAFTIVVKNIVATLDDGVVWQIHNTKILISIAVIIFWLLIFAWNIMNYLRDSIESIIVALLFLAAFASGIIMGMSPTVFASGDRVFLLSYLLLVVVIAFLVTRVINDYIIKEDS